MDKLKYTDRDGIPCEVKGVCISQDKAGRYWLWSEALEQNLAYKEKSREDMLLSAISSLLFIISLKQDQLNELQELQDKVHDFVYQVRGSDMEHE